jgi:hypothetical protein
MTNRIIHLSKCNVATYGEITLVAKGNRYDPCRPLVRQLIAEGFIEPDDIVEIYRGDMLCFAPCRAIHWATWDTVDDPRDGLVRRPAYIGPHVPDLKSGRGLLAPQRAPLQHERRAV